MYIFPCWWPICLENLILSANFLRSRSIASLSGSRVLSMATRGLIHKTNTPLSSHKMSDKSISSPIVMKASSCSWQYLCDEVGPGATCMSSRGNRAILEAAYMARGGSTAVVVMGRGSQAAWQATKQDCPFHRPRALVEQDSPLLFPPSQADQVPWLPRPLSQPCRFLYCAVQQVRLSRCWTWRLLNCFPLGGKKRCRHLLRVQAPSETRCSNPSSGYRGGGRLGLDWPHPRDWQGCRSRIDTRHSHTAEGYRWARQRCLQGTNPSCQTCDLLYLELVLVLQLLHHLLSRNFDEWGLGDRGQ